MAPKFGVVKQVIGIKGPHNACVGSIVNRLKVGNQNLLEIRWNIGAVTRVTTAFVYLYEPGGGNNLGVVGREVGVVGQIVDGNVQRDIEDESVGSESSEEIDVEDAGDLDG